MSLTDDCETDFAWFHNRHQASCCWNVSEAFRHVPFARMFASFSNIIVKKLFMRLPLERISSRWRNYRGNSFPFTNLSSVSGHGDFSPKFTHMNLCPSRVPLFVPLQPCELDYSGNACIRRCSAAKCRSVMLHAFADCLNGIVATSEMRFATSNRNILLCNCSWRENVLHEIDRFHYLGSCTSPGGRKMNYFRL